MDRIPYFQADSRSVSQEVLRTYWNEEDHDHTHYNHRSSLF
jgi:hypothetical protein